LAGDGEPEPYRIGLGVLGLGAVIGIEDVLGVDAPDPRSVIGHNEQRLLTPGGDLDADFGSSVAKCIGQEVPDDLPGP
jgi:hypothetical protein